MINKYVLLFVLQLVFEVKIDSYKIYYYSFGYFYYYRYGNIVIDDVYVFNFFCKSRNFYVLFLFLVNIFLFNIFKDVILLKDVLNLYLFSKSQWYWIQILGLLNVNKIVKCFFI